MTMAEVSLGGAVDMGESPAAAAVREAREEISTNVQLVRLVDVLGGPVTRSATPTADRAYVTAAYEARVIRGPAAPGDGELTELAWFTPGQLARPAAEPVLACPPSRRQPPLIHSAPYPAGLPADGSMGSAERAVCGRRVSGEASSGRASCPGGK
jgi:hypothetical protein